MEDEAITDLKRQINNMVWEHSPGDVTLAKGERIACDILAMIQRGWDGEQMAKELGPHESPA